MNGQAKPLILHVDDKPDDLRAWQADVDAAGTVRLEIRHPQDVTKADLESARLVLVDVRLDSWKERDDLPAVSLKPLNGLALLAVLQEHSFAPPKALPCAFALYTAQVDDVARGLIPRPHIVARAHNLEWVLNKTAPSAQRVEQVSILGHAVQALPHPWPADSAEKAAEALAQWLHLESNTPWFGETWRSVLRCRPPIHEFAEHTHGIGVLRWMLHRILPYPCFLIEDAHLAARLRVSPSSLKAELAKGGKLQELLEPARFSGQLADFSGRRWWRDAVESIVFGVSPDDPANLALLQERLRALAPGLDIISTGTVFPVLGADYVVKDALADQNDVVEVVPDDWPPFADPAWSLKTDVDDAADLKAIARREP